MKHSKGGEYYDPYGEKEEALLGTIPRKQRRASWLVNLCRAVVLCVAAGYWATVLLEGNPEESSPDKFCWKKIEPSEKLVYHPCFGDFECARLSVPLDYTNPRSKEKAVIAIVKLPADIEGGENSPEWGGPLLINPGGPGGSGTDFAKLGAKSLQAIVGKKYSIVGFDPRGIKHTTPLASCFGTEIDRVTSGLSNDRVISSGGDDVFGHVYSTTKAVASLCNNALGDTAGNVGTAFVARDMLRITEESWKALGKEPKGLIYWGFSYGTILGGHYATMFPDKIEKMVLDGVADYYDYMSTNWTKNLIEAEAGYNKFFEYCASSSRCALNTPGSTADSIRTRVTSLLENLRKEPIPVVTDTGYNMITYSFIYQLTFSSLYAPVTSFEFLATCLAALEVGDTDPIMHLIRESGALPRLTCDTGVIDSGKEAAVSVLCGEGDPVNDTPEMFREYYENLKKQSPHGADVWSTIRETCNGWKGRAKERVTKFGGQTSKPILFVGNTRDPVTPATNAYAMSKLFPGSEVIEMDSEGHCSIAAPSICMVSALSRYFNDSTVPKTGTICQPDVRPFEQISRIMSEEEIKLRDAVKQIETALHGSRMGSKRFRML